MGLSRRQTIMVVVLTTLVILVCGLLVSISVVNSAQIAQTLPIVGPLAGHPLGGTEDEDPAPTAVITPTIAPSPTPTPRTPQTRYDLQVEHEPRDPSLRVLRGEAYLELSALGPAMQDFGTAIGLDPTLAEAYLGRGRAEYILKEWTAALSDFDRAIEANSDLADAHAWRGFLLAEWGEYGRALEGLQQAVAVDASSAWYHTLLGQALLLNGDPEGAQGEFTVALWLDARRIDAYVGRAMTQAELGDLEAALADLESALDIAPYSWMALNGKARFYAEYRPERLAEAVQLAQRALAGANTDLEQASCLDTLGWAYHQLGQHEQALAALEEAATLATVEGQVVHAGIAAHLAQAKAALP